MSGIARAAAVDRSFLYRHRDLLSKIHALEAAPPVTGDATGPAVTRASLQADLLAAQERAVRLHARVQQLEKRLSEALGEQAWRASGLGQAQTSTSSASKPPACSNRTSACGSRSKNATKSSAPPAPPTGSSWPSSTPRRAGNQRHQVVCTTPVAHVRQADASRAIGHDEALDQARARLRAPLEADLQAAQQAGNAPAGDERLQAEMLLSVAEYTMAYAARSGSPDVADLVRRGWKIVLTGHAHA